MRCGNAQTEASGDGNALTAASDDGEVRGEFANCWTLGAPRLRPVMSCMCGGAMSPETARETGLHTDTTLRSERWTRFSLSLVVRPASVAAGKTLS